MQGSPEPDANAIPYTIEQAGIDEGPEQRMAMQDATAGATGRMARALRAHIAAGAGRKQGSGDASLVRVEVTWRAPEVPRIMMSGPTCRRQSPH